MQVWNVCVRLAVNIGRKKSLSAHNFVGLSISLQLRHVLTIGKKLVKQQYLLHMCSQYGERRPTNGWDWLVGLGHPGRFNGLHILASLLHRHRSVEVNQTLQDVCRLLGWYTIYVNFGGLLPHNRILPSAKFALRPSLAFSYIGSVTGRHSSSGCQPDFAAWYKEWNYGTFAEGATYIWLGGHHVGHRPTF